MARFMIDLPAEMVEAMRARHCDWRKVVLDAFAAELAKPPRDFLLVASPQPTHHRRAGLARSEKLSAERRSEIARMGAAKRWKKKP